jgi:putative ABC transport system permease protein
MGVFLSIAWRNILRNKKRSLLTALAIAVGLVAMIMIWSMFDGMYPVLVDNLTGFTGHLDISTADYVDKPFLEYTITDGAGIIRAVAANPAVIAYSPRLQCNAMISYGSNSQGALIIGVDPELERSFGKLAELVGEGGHWLQPGEEGLVLGAILAKNLDVSLGDKVLLVVSDRTQELAYLGPLDVVGLIRSGIPDIDRATAVVDRRLLASSVFVETSGQAAVKPDGVFSNLLIRIKNPDIIEGIQRELQAIMPSGVIVRTWKEVNPWVESSFRTKVGFAYIVFFIVLLIAMAGILNTILMSVVERTREFGIMRSLGTKRWQIFLTVVYESVMLGLLGIVAGTAIGVALVTYLGHVGIDLFSAMDQSMLGQFYIIDRIFYPRLGFEHFANTCLMIMLAVIFVSLYPARKAARMQPVEAIKTLGR